MAGPSRRLSRAGRRGRQRSGLSRVSCGRGCDAFSKGPCRATDVFGPAQGDAEDEELGDCDGSNADGEEGLEEDESAGEAEEDDEDDEDEGGDPYAAASWPARGGLYPGSAYGMQEYHVCANCTRSFWGGACRSCGHAAGEDVVQPEALAAALAAMAADGGAPARAQPASAAADASAVSPAPPAPHEAAVLLAYDDRCRGHLEEASPGSSARGDLGRSHPERPERVAAVMVRLQASGLLPRCGAARERGAEGRGRAGGGAVGDMGRGSH